MTVEIRRTTIVTVAVSSTIRISSGSTDTCIDAVTEQVVAATPTPWQRALEPEPQRTIDVHT